MRVGRFPFDFHILLRAPRTSMAIWRNPLNTISGHLKFINNINTKLRIYLPLDSMTSFVAGQPAVDLHRPSPILLLVMKIGVESFGHLWMRQANLVL